MCVKKKELPVKREKMLTRKIIIIKIIIKKYEIRAGVAIVQGKLRHIF